jgi:Flp pilus assembly protein TadD
MQNKSRVIYSQQQARQRAVCGGIATATAGKHVPRSAVMPSLNPVAGGTEPLDYNAVKASMFGAGTTRSDFMKLGVSQIILSLVLAAGTGPASAADIITHEDLLSGAAVFGERVDISKLPDPGILEMDDTMRAFVAEQIGGANSGREKLRRLLGGMIESGLLSLDYNQVETKTAKQTFYDRLGNCISFTNLFVALGREAGLDVSYQTVDVPPMWYEDSDLVILNKHINALINTRFEGDVVVDFNVSEFKGNYESHPVDDSYAFALYHNNIAMDALTDGRIEESFRYLKKAILLDPTVPGPWVNLGVFYSKQELPDYAMAAYETGLDLDPKNRSALTNIAALHRSLGNEAAANRYSRRIRAYQKRNPYFHYYRAQFAYENDRIDEAQQSLHRAIKLKKNEHQFYFLMGMINYKLGNQQEALENFVKARELAGYASERQKYNAKIELLAGSQSMPVSD